MLRWSQHHRAWEHYSLEKSNCHLYLEALILNWLNYLSFRTDWLKRLQVPRTAEDLRDFTKQLAFCREDQAKLRDGKGDLWRFLVADRSDRLRIYVLHPPCTPRQDGLPGSLDFMAFMRQGTKTPRALPPQSCLDWWGLWCFWVESEGRCFLRFSARSQIITKKKRTSGKKNVQKARWGDTYMAEHEC